MGASSGDCRQARRRMNVARDDASCFDGLQWQAFQAAEVPFCFKLWDWDGTLERITTCLHRARANPSSDGRIIDTKPGRHSACQPQGFDRAKGHRLQAALLAIRWPLSRTRAPYPMRTHSRDSSRSAHATPLPLSRLFADAGYQRPSWPQLCQPSPGPGDRQRMSTLRRSAQTADRKRALAWISRNRRLARASKTLCSHSTLNVSP